ncbi:MAG: hypothetical protein LKE40_08335 [Spirochaetia bacterium]|jgi:hypothetical protein|nr:hypothetical protein [Spirochaetia bacterium]
MSKYDPLWKSIQARDEGTFRLSFGEIEQILGFPIDHSFLNFKKELLDYGYQVGKISLKEKWVTFSKCKE